MNQKNKLAKNLLRRNTVLSGVEPDSNIPGSSNSRNVCQRCQRFEVDLNTTSDNLSATDSELRASRQVISLLQRQLELTRIEKEGLEKLIVSQSIGIDLDSGSIDPDDHLLQLGDIDGTDKSEEISSPKGTKEVQKRLLKLIETQLYAKDEEIIKLRSSLKESKNEREQISLQRHDLEDAVSKLKSEIELLRLNLELRDKTIISLSNEVFDQGNGRDSQRRQSSAEALYGQSKTHRQLRQIAKLDDNLEAYKKTNELLIKNVLDLTDRCATAEKREMEFKSQAQELEARCCQIHSKLLSLLKEIESSKQPSTEKNSPTSDSQFIHNERVTILIKRLLEDESLDIPLSWKEGNRTGSRSKQNEAQDSSGKLCDELGFYLVSNEKCNKVSLNQDKGRPPLKRGSSEGTYPSHLSAVEEFSESESINEHKRKDSILHNSVRSSKNEESSWKLGWDDFIKDFDKANLSNSKEFKNLLRSSVPQEYRCKIWKALVDLKVGKERANRSSDYYQSLLLSSQTDAKQQMKPSSKQIELDLLRTLPNNKYFETIDSPGTVRLRRVLTAFAAHAPHIGYCQGMNRLAAVALLVLPEEEAFWCLISIVEKIMPTGYYNDLWLAQVDSNVVMDFVGVMMPELYAHFQAYDIELSLFAWFLTIFVDGTSPSLFLRLWDCFLYEGDKIMFRVALALLKINEKELMKHDSSAAVNSYLRTIINSPMDMDQFFGVAFNSINPLPGKTLRGRRESHFLSMKANLRSINGPNIASSSHVIAVDHDDDSQDEQSSVISV